MNSIAPPVASSFTPATPHTHTHRSIANISKPFPTRVASSEQRSGAAGRAARANLTHEWHSNYSSPTAPHQWLDQCQRLQLLWLQGWRIRMKQLE